MNPSSAAESHTAKWLVGERLSCVLHLGDASLAYRLSEQGHEVVVAGDDAVTVRNPAIGYVRTAGERLPFTSDSFDVVVVPHFDESTGTLAEYARVLRPGGLVSTLTQRRDESIPWVRRLREIIGSRPEPSTAIDTFVASGLFAEPEVDDVATWENLDLAGLLQFAHDTGEPGIGEQPIAAVHALFAEYGSHMGFLRLRHETHCMRARVLKDTRESEPVPDTTLFNLA